MDIFQNTFIVNLHTGRKDFTLINMKHDTELKNYPSFVHFVESFMGIAPDESDAILDTKDMMTLSYKIEENIVYWLKGKDYDSGSNGN